MNDPLLPCGVCGHVVPKSRAILHECVQKYAYNNLRYAFLTNTSTGAVFYPMRGCHIITRRWKNARWEVIARKANDNAIKAYKTSCEKKGVDISTIPLLHGVPVETESEFGSDAESDSDTETASDDANTPESSSAPTSNETVCSSTNGSPLESASPLNLPEDEKKRASTDCPTPQAAKKAKIIHAENPTQTICTKSAKKSANSASGESSTETGKHWTDDEIKDMLLTYQSLNVDKLKNTTGIRTKEIFVKVAEKMKDMGYTRAASSVEAKFNKLMTKFKSIKAVLSNSSGTGTEEKNKFKFYDLINELCVNRPVNNLQGAADSLDTPEERAQSCRPSRSNMYEALLKNTITDDRLQQEEFMINRDEISEAKKDERIDKLVSVWQQSIASQQYFCNNVLQMMYMNLTLQQQATGSSSMAAAPSTPSSVHTTSVSAASSPAMHIMVGNPMAMSAAQTTPSSVHSTSVSAASSPAMHMMAGNPMAMSAAQMTPSPVNATSVSTAVNPLMQMMLGTAMGTTAASSMPSSENDTAMSTAANPVLQMPNFRFPNLMMTNAAFANLAMPNLVMSSNQNLFRPPVTLTD